MMCEMLVTSMPRPTTSVATRSCTSPARNAFITRSRALCSMSPCIMSAAWKFFAQPAINLLGAALRAAEDDRLLGLLALEQLHQQIELSLVVDGEIELLDRVDRLRLGREVHHLRIAHVRAGQPLDRRRRPWRSSSSVCRSLGQRRRIFSMSGRKPMSSMRSASSSTTMLNRSQVERAAADDDRARGRACRRSRRRPAASLAICPRIGLPP